MNEPLTRSRTNRMIAGVCGGISERYGIDATLVRVLTVAITLFTAVPLIAYLVLWLLLPEDSLA